VTHQIERLGLFTCGDQVFTYGVVSQLFQDHGAAIKLVVCDDSFFRFRRVLSSLYTFGAFRCACFALSTALAKLRRHTLVRLCTETGVPLIFMNKRNRDRVQGRIAEEPLDLGISINFDQRVPGRILNAFRYGVINVHFGDLPRYAGLYPVYWAWRAGEPRLGLTVHLMDEQFDHGPIVVKHYIENSGAESLFALYRKAFALTNRLINQAIERLRTGRATTPMEGPGSYHSHPNLRDYLSGLTTPQPALRSAPG